MDCSSSFRPVSWSNILTGGIECCGIVTIAVGGVVYLQDPVTGTILVISGISQSILGCFGYCYIGYLEPRAITGDQIRDISDQLDQLNIQEEDVEEKQGCSQSP